MFAWRSVNAHPWVGVQNCSAGYSPALRVVAVLWLVTTLACAAEPEAANEEPSPAEAESTALPEGAEALSLFGEPLYGPQLSEEARQRLEGNYNEAQSNLETDPDNEENIIWLGRRAAYLSRYQEAIRVYTSGLKIHPASYKLHRHRGHRFITTRQFDRAIEDLERAAELVEGLEPETEPDGIPNRLNTPLSNGHFNIWYHLGLAYYLKGDFESARRAYVECMKFSDNADLLVATSDWLYMTYRRLGMDEEAAEVLEPIHAGLEIVENDAYHRRLLMYKGEVAPEDLLDLRVVDDPDTALSIATQGYGVGNLYLVEGDRERAEEIFRRILEGTSWAAFGYIAAESDLHRFSGEGLR